MRESYPDMSFSASAMGVAVIWAGVLIEVGDCVNN